MRGLLIVVGVGALLAGCTAVGGDTPKRPSLTVADEVQQIDPEQLIGTWTCRELNPYPEVPQQVSTITYAQGGTFTSKAQYDAQTPPFGAMSIVAAGRWAVEGDRIVTSDVKTSAASQDAFTNAMAGIAISIMNSISDQQQGSGDVLKLTPTELGYRAAGVDDPPVYSCVRQRV